MITPLFYSDRSNWATALLLAILAFILTVDIHAGGKGNSGKVGGDVSGWIFAGIEFDDHYLNNPDNGPNGLVSDGKGAYVDGADQVEARIGRNRNILIDLNTHKKKASIRKFKFQYLDGTGQRVPGFPPIESSCASLEGTVCFPTLGSGDPITCPPDPLLHPVLEADGSAPDAQLEILGEDHDDTPVGCSRHVNARLQLKDVNGITWWVFFGSRAYPGASFFSPCGSCITATRLENLDADGDGIQDDPGISQWEFYSQAPHTAYVFRDNNPPHAPSEFYGTITLSFSGVITSQSEEPVPAGQCWDFPDSEPCP